MTYLTDPSLEQLASAGNPDADHLPAVIVEALENADAEVVAPLAVMNLVMPTATGAANVAKGDSEAAAASALTAVRAKRVLRALLVSGSCGPAASSQLRGARVAADCATGLDGDEEWTAFYKRWKYNDAQMTAVRGALDDALAVL